MHLNCTDLALDMDDSEIKISGIKKERGIQSKRAWDRERERSR